MRDITDAHTRREGRAWIAPTLDKETEAQKEEAICRKTSLCNYYGACVSGFLHLCNFCLAYSVSGNALVSLSLCVWCVPVSDSAFQVFLPCFSPLHLSLFLSSRTTTTLLPGFKTRGWSVGVSWDPPNPQTKEENKGTLHPGPFPDPKAQDSKRGI